MTNTFDPSQQTPAAPQQFDPLSGPAEEIVIDLSGVSDDYEPIPDGWYLLNVDNIKATDDSGAQLMSKNNEPKAIWVFKVAQGEATGRLLFQHTNLSGKGAFGLRRILKAFHGDDLPKSQMKINLANYRGKNLWALVKRQKNDDRYNEITQFRPESSPPEGPTGAMPFAPQTQPTIAGRI